MPSRHIPPSAPPVPPPLNHPISPTPNHLVSPIAGGFVAAFSFLIALTLCFRKLTHKRTVPSPNTKSPHRFSYSSLRRATSSFSPSHRLGQGGFGSVYRGTLNTTTHRHQNVAVKVMDAGSLQGEREFQNELILSANFDSPYILSLIGFSSDRKRRRMLLVYELMVNGSLQDCLLHRKSIQLKYWKTRFSVALDIAKGLEYLHHYCDPPVIHGDIKPSNILLDSDFRAKIGDFGLAALKLEDFSPVEAKKEFVNDDNVSVETESVVTGNVFDDLSMVDDRSPESFVRVKVGEVSPEALVDVPSPSCDKLSVCEGNFDRGSLESGKDIGNGKRKKSGSGKDWWWKQDNGVGESGRGKDYVMEWIGSEIKKERPMSEWIGGSSGSKEIVGKSERKKSRRRLDWWVSLDEDKVGKKEKRRPAREWWKEEYCEELARKKKKKKKKQGNSNADVNEENWWPKDDEEMYVEKKKQRSRSRGSRGSIDWWLDGLSGELWRARGNSHDSVSGEIPKSGGISSTPSMRGTVCYVAPEYGSGANLSEKCDVYSFGVVLLVLISGRRPLQITGSPISEFKRANLLSWARHLARAGKLLDLVDQSIQSLNKEQALLCITVALLCLQKSPAHRPSMKEVVGMLSGDLEPPTLPVEFSPSPPSRYRSKAHKKPR